MPSDSEKVLADTVRRYVALLAAGSADDLIALFAENATVEDPVGGPIRGGRDQIHEFFSTLEQMERETELVLLRVVGNEAAFVFTITFTVGDTKMRLQPVDTVVFNSTGEIVSLRSYFTPSDMAAV
jgi:steroid delta-isomerase